MHSALDSLPELAREVFRATWGAPTPAQELAWPAISAGDHVLVAAPTGSGKTLAAFYAFLARMIETPAPAPGVELLYISPLKALASDVEKNLRVPLAALRQAAIERGLPHAAVPVAVRSGDTPQKERAAAVRRPPRVLVTTPESLYLLLTGSKARATLATVRAVIIDEAHALVESKRGAHLLLSLERLERVTGRPVQRIGLSATAPLVETAAWLAGLDATGSGRALRILDAGGRKQLDLQVLSPPPDAPVGQGQTWPTVARQLVRLAEAHRSTLVFCNSRRLAERLTAYVNDAAGRALAHAHHGAVARERRLELEERLKAGELPMLIATGSLELGIDVGAIDLVVQIGSPKSVARGLQRVGRAGHLVGATAKGRIIGALRSDLLESATVARGMLELALEPVRAPENCLDVLAQQVAAEVAGAPEPVPVRELYECFRRAHSYRTLAFEDFTQVVEMLAGRFDNPLLRDFRARLDWDRRRHLLGPLPGTRARATARPGTIPDRGYYRVELEGERARLGELDEEFVHESRAGDVFVLGTSAWRITRIQRDRVVVKPAAPGEPARMPFWRGEGLGRGAALGARVGALAREIGGLLPDRDAAVARLRTTCVTDENAARAIVELLARQADATALVPDDRTVIIERFEDDEGYARVALLSPWGGRLHLAWAILIAAEARRRLGIDLAFVPSDDGILFRTPEGEAAEALLGAGTWLRSDEVAARLEEEVPGTPLYAALFREAAQRALVLGLGARGKRAPLWLSRLRAADLEQIMRAEPDFPVAREARREALTDVLDVRALATLLASIERGEMRVVEARRSLPSPFAAQLLLGFTIAFMYEGDSPRVERRARALSAGRDVAVELLAPEELEDLLEADAVAALEARRQHTATGTRARTPEELIEILRRVGDLTTSEAVERAEIDARAALVSLAAEGRVARVKVPAGDERWVAAEDEELWREVTSAADGDERGVREIVRRFAAARGPFTADAAAARWGFPRPAIDAALARLTTDGVLARGRFVRAGGQDTFADRRNLVELHRRTLSILRDRGAPAPASAFAAFLLQRHRAATVAGAVSLLAGVRAPIESLERDLVWRRVAGYHPALLDAACANGEVAWFLDGNKAALVPRAELAAWVPDATDGAPAALDAEEAAVLAALDTRGAQFAGELLASARIDTAALFRALWSLARRGLVGNDAYEALRRAVALDFQPQTADLDAASTVDALRRARRAKPSPWVGRFTRLPGAQLAPEERAAVQAQALLRRYGVVGKTVADAEPGTRPWPELEAALARLELRGEVVRGYFVDGLGAYQVALAPAVDDLRGKPDPHVLTLVSATDPVCVYGALAPLPGDSTRLARVPSSYLILRAGAPLFLVEGHGKRVTPLPDAEPLDDDTRVAALRLLRLLLAPPGALRAVRSLRLDEYAGAPAAAAAKLLERAGFRRDGERMVMGVLEAEAAARVSS
jgi:ATP-dependent Lhr-like helicase